MYCWSLQSSKEWLVTTGRYPIYAPSSVFHVYVGWYICFLKVICTKLQLTWTASATHLWCLLARDLCKLVLSEFFKFLMLQSFLKWSCQLQNPFTEGFSQVCYGWGWLVGLAGTSCLYILLVLAFLIIFSGFILWRKLNCLWSSLVLRKRRWTASGSCTCFCWEGGTHLLVLGEE